MRNVKKSHLINPAFGKILVLSVALGIAATGCQSNPRPIRKYQGEQYYPSQSTRPTQGSHRERLAKQPKRVGYASFYGEELRGSPMANGVPFNPDLLTAASWFFPFGTRIQVVHKNRSVIVTITDRGPALRLVRQGRIIDLSEAAFTRLADPRLGLIYVRLYRLPDDS